LVRLRMGDISVIGRNTKGVTLIDCPDSERVIALSRMPESDQDDGDDEHGGDFPAVDENGSDATDEDIAQDGVDIDD